MFDSCVGKFFVISFNFIFSKGQSLLIKISSTLILLLAKGTLSKAPGASNFLCKDLAISISGEMMTSIGKFSLL
jgi:hypothetical protein